MSFMTYKDARPWAKAIKTAVLTKKMPPWFADPHYGKFSNDRSLSQAEIDTLVAWVDGGAKEGDPKDAPKPREFFTGWTIGKPDAGLRACRSRSTFRRPAWSNTPTSIIPTGFTEDKWIQTAEARAGARGRCIT